MEYIDGPSEKKVVDVAGTLPYYDGIALCVAADDETDAVNREEPTVEKYYDDFGDIPDRPPA